MGNPIYTFLFEGIVDTGARTASLVALVLSFAGLVFHRLDKYRERRMDREKAFPIINISLDKTKAPRMWTIEFSFTNRAEVPVDIPRVEVISPANLFLFEIKKTARGTRVRNEETKSRDISPNVGPIAVKDEEEWRGILAPADQSEPIDLNADLELVIHVLFHDFRGTKERIKIKRPLWPVD